jgi:hypothetical protein
VLHPPQTALLLPPHSSGARWAASGHQLPYSSSRNTRHEVVQHLLLDCVPTVYLGASA